MSAIEGKLKEYHAPATFAVEESNSKEVVLLASEKLAETTYAKDTNKTIGHTCGGRSLTGTKK